jgi:hypothetical protein
MNFYLTTDQLQLGHSEKLKQWTTGTLSDLIKYRGGLHVYLKTFLTTTLHVRNTWVLGSLINHIPTIIVGGAKLKEIHTKTLLNFAGFSVKSYSTDSL